MKNVVATIAFLTALPALGNAPTEVWIDMVGEFDSNRQYTGYFAASGAFDASGTLIDVPRFSGQGIHITRTMFASETETLAFAINANHVTGLHVAPTWCPPPSTIPTGMVLVPESGTWSVLYGTGKYAGLQGTGSWAAWVVVDFTLGLPIPLSATECMEGKVQID